MLPNDDSYLSSSSLQAKSKLTTILKKLRNQFYKNVNDPELRRYWMPDSNSRECYDCSEKFTTIRRKHHCRVCGQIFCNKCCKEDIPGSSLGYSSTTNLRACNYCYKFVTSFFKNESLTAADDGLNLSEKYSKKNPLQVISNNSSMSTFRSIKDMFLTSETIDNYHNRCSNESEKKLVIEDASCSNSSFQKLKTSSPISTFKRKNSIGFREEDYAKSTSNKFDFDTNSTSPYKLYQAEKSILSFFHNSSSIENKNSMMPNSLSFQEGNKTTPNWFREISLTDNAFDEKSSESLFSSNEVESDILQTKTSFTNTDKKNKRDTIDQAETETSTQNSMDYGFEMQLDFKNELVPALKFIKKEKKPTVSFQTKPIEKKQSQILPFDIKSNVNVIYSNPFIPTSSDVLASSSLKALQNLNFAFEKLSTKLLIQLLDKENVFYSWVKLIKSLAKEVSQRVSPNCISENHEMDIQQYVKMKKIPGGNKADSFIVNGLVISKNVTHRKMNQKIINPKILLLSCPIVYHHRAGQKLTTLDSILLQEHNYLKNLVIKISTYSPDIVIVDKTFARTAKEILLELGITLVCNVKSSVLEKISRFTGAEIVNSLEAQIGSPQLGHCEKFYVKTFNSFKTLMFFDGCSPELGCTLVLRGSQSEEVLKKVKNICYFMIYCYYNWRLESSLLMNLYALSPETLNNNLGFNADEIQNDNESETTSCDLKISKENLNSFKFTWTKIEDESDPLRLMASDTDQSLLPSQITSSANLKSSSLKSYSANFLSKKVSYFLSNTILICSPFIAMELPYFLTQEGALCPLKRYFDIENSFWFNRFKNDNILEKKESLLKVEEAALSNQKKSQAIERIKTHLFITSDLKHNLSSSDTLDLLADFRARGSTYPKIRQTVINFNDNIASSISLESVIDPLSEKYHQRLPILYFSFSYSSSLSPFCLNPWIVMMEFYGSRDISLGTFLEKYCFSTNYTCPATGCSTSMIQHIRKFVHGNGAINIFLKKLNNDLECAESNIVTWSVCQNCGTSSIISNLSKDSKSFSFAKFLELKLYGHAYGIKDSGLSSNACSQHSLFKDHVQYFAFKKTVACFKYQFITINELALPSSKIKLNFDPLATFSFKADVNFLNDQTVLTNQKKLTVVINENDFGSIIAYFLTSSEYEKQLNDIIKDMTSPNTKKKLLASLESNASSAPSEIKDSQFEVSIGSSAVCFNSKAIINQNSNCPHINLQYSHGTTEFHCCVFFADQFKKLRSELIILSGTSGLIHNVEEAYIKSLSHCIPWVASGGKSGAKFCKTADDRFILKEMKKAELHSFLSIAKCYFDYVIFALNQSKPTLLAKIFGVYKISYKNATNSISKLYLLVMENLFYDRNISLKYDLKGSVRNRLASPDTDNDVVLLDENLITVIRETPFYVRNHTKKILQNAIDNDSSFLSFLSIMDYSLLVGIDEDRKEFVAGIIDYIRSYTWDKKIEMMVKSVGGHGMPTIVSPNVYKERFCEKMNQYFLCVPDRWYKLESLDKPFARLDSYSSCD